MLKFKVSKYLKNIRLQTIFLQFSFLMVVGMVTFSNNSLEPWSVQEFNSTLNICFNDFNFHNLSSSKANLQATISLHFNVKSNNYS